MFIIKKIKTIKFLGSSSKDAYLKACKFISQYIELPVTYEIKKLNEDIPAFEVTFYVKLDEKDFSSRFCDICREFHGKFYINQQLSCNNCNMLNFKNRYENALREKKNVMHKKIEK